MYVFVRFAAVVMIIFGVLLMLASVGGAVYGITHNQAVTELANQAITVGPNQAIINAGYALTLVGLAGFILGMLTSALGQLLVIFIDLSEHTKETNRLLRSMRARD